MYLLIDFTRDPPKAYIIDYDAYSDAQDAVMNDYLIHDPREIYADAAGDRDEADIVVWEVKGQDLVLPERFRLRVEPG